MQVFILPRPTRILRVIILKTMGLGQVSQSFQWAMIEDSRQYFVIKIWLKRKLVTASSNPTHYINGKERQLTSLLEVEVFIENQYKQTINFYFRATELCKWFDYIVMKIICAKGDSYILLNKYNFHDRSYKPVFRWFYL